MAGNGINRERSLTREAEAHPAAALIGQAGSANGASGGATPPAAARVHGPGPAEVEEEEDDVKRQVNFRLPKRMIGDIQKASVIYGFRQGRRISQNKIVETAIQEWMDRNGPWNF